MVRSFSEEDIQRLQFDACVLVAELVRAGVSKTEIAHACGVTPAAVSHWLSRKAGPRPAARERLKALHAKFCGAKGGAL